MRIAIEAQRIFRKNKHGMDFVALEIIKELQKIDKTNEYYIITAPGDERDILSETPNFKIVVVNCSFYPLWEQVALPLALKKIKPDILHCTANTAPLYCRIPLILTLHDVIFLEKRASASKSFYQNMGWYYRKLVVPKVLKKCKLILTVSQSEAERIKSLPEMANSNVMAVYNGVGEHFKVQESSSEIKRLYTRSEDYIFFLGNTDPKKNSERVFKAYSIYLQKSSIKLPLLVADLDKRHIVNILQKINALGIIDKIIAAGYIPNNHLPHVYSGASVFLYPSLRESFGIPQLEAMACGTPVISSNTSAMPEVCADAAILVDPYNTGEIADALLLFEDENRREDYIIKGLERVKQFSWEHSAKKVLEIYNNF